ncbi:F-box protein At2g17036-like [Silene latifolia]|uniref:F-box protein At2g17036-like n=1 Tax=Silene latifolia TaxID=37657 RepID=UPI003D77B565
MALRCTRHGSTGGTCDWAELPCDIIVSIFEHLDDYRIDQRRAASVCVAWRRAGSLLNFKKPSIIKLPFICTCRAYNNIANCVCRHRNDYSELSPNSLYFFISPALNRTQTRVWLIRAEEIGMNKWLLRPPSSSDHRIIPPGLEYNFNLLDVDKILGVAKVYFSVSEITPCVRKVISVSDLGLFLVLFGDEGGDKGKLALWSEDSKKWSYIDSGNCEIDDIINLRDQLYGIDTIGRLVMINPTTLDFVEVASPPKGIEYDVTIMYLVCSDGFLYLVYKGFVGAEARWKDYRYFNRIQSLKEIVRLDVAGKSPPEIGDPKDVGVFIFDKQTRAWVRVENIGDKVFFITEYASFSVTTKQLGLSQWSFICFMCKDFGYVPDSDKAPIIYKLNGNVCRKQENLYSDIKVDFGPPPKWIRPMLHSSKERKSRKSKRKKGRKGK